jgi:hypothetical protein
LSALSEDIAFRVLAVVSHPNIRTISDCRRIPLATLESLFGQVLQIALEAGAVKAGQVARWTGRSSRQTRAGTRR